MFLKNIIFWIPTLMIVVGLVVGVQCTEGSSTA